MCSGASPPGKSRRAYTVTSQGTDRDARSVELRVRHADDTRYGDSHSFFDQPDFCERPEGEEGTMILLRRLLGDALRQQRLAQERTLRDVSAGARVSLGYLSEVERGQKEASSELLSSICDALGVQLSTVLREVSDELHVLESAGIDPAVVPMSGVVRRSRRHCARRPPGRRSSLIHLPIAAASCAAGACCPLLARDTPRHAVDTHTTSSCRGLSVAPDMVRNAAGSLGHPGRASQEGTW